MLDELQWRSVARELPQQEPQQEDDNLLIEAVSLLVQRQRETERWVAEQIDRADDRAASVERRYADIEGRLAGIEYRLERLVRELEPSRADAGAGQRLARLREQVEDLKSETDGRPVRPVPTPPAEVRRVDPPPPPAPRQVDPVPVSRGPEAGPAASQVVVARSAEPDPPAAVGVGGPRARASGSDLFGATTQERFGAALMFLGLVAVLYAILTQLRF